VGHRYSLTIGPETGPPRWRHRHHPVKRARFQHSESAFHAQGDDQAQDQGNRYRGLRESRRHRPVEFHDRHRLLRIDITVKAVGDLHVDYHHTTEDVGIALGQAVKQALGDMAGITRYASVHMPMDETLTRVVIDISGRAVLVFKSAFPTHKIGEFDTELVREWFNAFASNAGVTLHVETLYGENSHHIAESCFKGLARALRTAVAIDPRNAGEVPSSKGQLGG
jgi:imidazoleglycerol-phosphate dehydratase